MANPVLSAEVFEGSRSSSSQVMTISGAIQKSFILGLLCLGAGWFSFKSPATPAWVTGYAIVGLVIALIISFKAQLAPLLSPIYAVIEGLFLGAVSAVYDAQFNGIVLQAVAATACVFFVMLLAYQTRVIQPTKRFVSIVISATLGIFIFYVISWVARLVFGVSFSPMNDSGPIGIGLGVVVCIIAALNLIIDFGTIEEGAEAQAPKYMEWYAAFGLLVTIVWLYLEILRLLSKLRRD